MNISEVFKNVPVLTPERIRELQCIKNHHGWSMEQVVDFMIEWDKATAKLLLSEPRTSSEGVKRMEMVRYRKQEKKLLKEKGVIK